MDNKEYVCYCVGDKYDKVMKGDGAIFEMNEDKCFINIGFTDISEAEIQAISQGKLNIFLSVIEGVVFVSASFDNKLIMDMPFNAGLYPDFNIKNPAPFGYIVPIIAVDNRTNIIKAIRVVGFDAEFSAKLYAFAEKQWSDKITNHDERVESVYKRYSPTDIIKHAILKNKVEEIL